PALRFQTLSGCASATEKAPEGRTSVLLRKPLTLLSKRPKGKMTIDIFVEMIPVRPHAEAESGALWLQRAAGARSLRPFGRRPRRAPVAHIMSSCIRLDYCNKINLYLTMQHSGGRACLRSRGAIQRCAGYGKDSAKEGSPTMA